MADFAQPLVQNSVIYSYIRTYIIVFSQKQQEFTF